MKALKIIGIIFLVLLLAAGGVGIYFYFSFKDNGKLKDEVLPKIEGVALDIKEINATHSDLIIHLNLKNELPVDFAADSVRYDIFIDSAKVASTLKAKPINLAAHDSAWVELPVEITNDSLRLALHPADKRDSAWYRIECHVFKMQHDLSFKVERHLPLFHFLDINIRSHKLHKLHRGSADLAFDVVFVNGNVFPLRLRDIKYRFAAGNHPWLSGARAEVLNVPPRDSVREQFILNLPFKDLGKTIKEVWVKKKDITYRMRMTFRIANDSSILRNAKITVVSRDTIGSVIQLLKNKEKPIKR